jgi:hypothetical protein
MGHAKVREFRKMTTTALTRNDVARRFYQRMQGQLLSGTAKFIKTVA